MFHSVYLALGTNLGNKNQNLENGLKLIAERIGTLSAVSSIYETEPWGFDSPNSFLNMAVKIETELYPFDLLNKTKELEYELGRTQKTTQNYQDRIIDVDIILYDDLILQSEQLILPHPLFHQRDFVLKPLIEITPDLIHPVFGKAISELKKSF